MFDVSDDAKGGFRRIEILTGPARRRRWSVDEKARIVAETLEPGARVSEVARRWHLHPQQVFGWRRAARHERSLESDGAASSGFVPIVAEAPLTETAARAASAAPIIEVKLAGAVVRISGVEDGRQLTTVLRAVRASATKR